MSNRGTSIGITPFSAIPYSPHYVGHWKCTQAVGSGAVVDASGNALNLALGSSLTDDASGPWGANDGQLTLPGKVDGDADGKNFSAVAATAYPGVDFRKHGLIISLFHQQAASDNTSVIGDVIACGGYSAGPGWALRQRGTGVWNFVIYGGSEYDTGVSSSDTDDGALHHILLAFDGPTDLATLYVDGTADGNINATDLSGAAAALTTFQPLAFGTAVNAAAAYANPGRYLDVHILHVPGGIPSNIGYLVKRLRANRYAPLSPRMVA